MNRPDGVIVIWNKSWYQTKWRPPMDHGSSTAALGTVFQAFLYPANETPVKLVPITYRANVEQGETDMPALIWSDGRLRASACYQPGQVLAWPGHPCAEDDRHLVGQTAHRAEDARTEGRDLVLAIGPNQERDCRINLAALPGGLPSAETLSRYSASYTPFLLAHFPGSASYLVDRSKAALPLFRLRCGLAPELLGSLAAHNDPADQTDVLDLVPGSDPARPLALLVTNERPQDAILRDPRQLLKAIPIELIDRDRVAFLARDGRQVIVKLDYPFETAHPSVRLTLFDTITGKLSTQEVAHDFAEWPERP